MHRIEVLDMPVDCVTKEKAIQRITGFLRSAGQFHIATPNPEMMVEAQRNPAFKAVLQSTSLNLPDGIGLVWAMRQKGFRNPGEKVPDAFSRVTGTDTLLTLCSSTSRISPPEKIFLLGAAEGIAERAAEVLIQRNPGLKIVGTFAGSTREEEERAIIEHVNAAQPTLLFVAYGAPHQDLWIARNLSKMPSVKVAMGVGGAFDFIAGKQKRAPRMLQNLGLEWFWRLLREPRRIKRIWNAVVVFPWMVLARAEKAET